MQPPVALASDVFGPLVEIWKTLASDPETLVQWYSERYKEYFSLAKPGGYEQIKARYSSMPNGADLLFLCRSMLRRFQREGESLEDDVVHDRLLLTYS